MNNSRRPQQARQPGAAGGQGNAGAGQRSGNKEAAQPPIIPVSKSMITLNCFM